MRDGPQSSQAILGGIVARIKKIGSLKTVSFRQDCLRTQRTSPESYMFVIWSYLSLKEMIVTLQRYSTMAATIDLQDPI